MTQTIKKVKVDQILPLRQRILRAGYPLNECRFEGDRAESTFHLALFEQEKILAVASFMKAQTPNSSFTDQYRLRGMAVAENHQGEGLGKAIFKEGLRQLEIRKVPYLWFNARSHAIDFYKKQGCCVLGKEFVIPTVGPHYFMFKELMT